MVSATTDTEFEGDGTGPGMQSSVAATSDSRWALHRAEGRIAKRLVT